MPVNPKDASTLMLLRQHGSSPFEVLMVKRSSSIDFAQGQFVFPGGKLDEADCSPEILSLCTGMPDEAYRRQMRAIDRVEMIKGLYVCAIRETFEETGILTGAVDLKDKQDRLADMRNKLNRNEISFFSVLQQAGGHLDIGSLYYFSNWITPELSPKRFDTKFFVTLAPENFTLSTDMHEIIDAVWISPQDALEKNGKDEFPMIFPTIRNLMELSKFKSVADLVSYLRNHEIKPVMPAIIFKDEKIFIKLDESDELFLFKK